MLKLLIHKQLSEIFRAYLYDAKKNKTRSKGATAAYIVLFVLIMAGMLGGMFTYLSLSICEPLSAAGMDWLYFALMGLIAILLGSFGSVFNTYSGLYLAKDNDLLLSMPIPVGVIMTARLLVVYIMGLLYSGVVIIPAAAVSLIKVSAAVGSVIGSFMSVLLISVFVLTLSCILGWVVAKISLKLKNKSVITVFVSIMFLAAYYFVYFKAQSLISELIANAAVYGEKIKGSAYPIYLAGKAGTGDPAALAIVTAVVIALFALMWVLISRSFLKTATSAGKNAKKKYRSTAVAERRLPFALLAKEFGRFASSPSYMLNCGLGVLLLPVLGAVFLIKGGSFISILGEMFGPESSADCIPVIVCTAICAAASMNDMAAPSVSLEGRSLWLAQSLPVVPWQILRAKLSVQLILTVFPAIFCFACAVIVYPFAPAQILVMLLVLISYTLLSALFDLFIGLKMPNLTWTNEITPIKQSLGVMLALFGGFVYAVAIPIAFFTFGYKIGFAAFAGCYAAITLILCAILYIWLRKRGSETFASL